MIDKLTIQRTTVHTFKKKSNTGQEIWEEMHQVNKWKEAFPLSPSPANPSPKK